MSVEMRRGRVVCILCQRSEETKVTGPLSTKECLVNKDSVTAHQNCLLYSSGIYCQDTPEFDDLFGFAVEDVKLEVKRGNRLFCTGCKKKCATVGCEVKRCKRSYHYPCAVEHGAEAIEDESKGKYALFCCAHRKLEIKSDVDTPASSRRNRDTSKPLTKCSSKVICLVCEKREENISLDSLNDDVVLLYCQEHKPQSHEERPNGMDEAAGLAHSSDSSLKRKLKSNGRQDEVPSKVKVKRKIESSSSDDDLSCQSQTIFAPIEWDSQIHRNDSENVCGSTSGIAGNDTNCQSQDGCEDETDISFAESESLLLPVTICMESDSSQMTVPKPKIDSARFWKDLNEAGRTKAFFSDFIDELNDICNRIQSNQASQEDYDVALRVMEASGSLTALVAKQDEEIKKKKVEVQIEEAAMKRIVSAMGR